MAQQKSKYNNEEPKFNFDPTPNHKDSLEAEIKDKVDAAKQAKNNRTFASLGQIATFPLIVMHRDQLLYNLENDRTISLCEENIKVKQDKNYFSNENVWNKENQNEYHKIIYSFVPKKMGDILGQQSNQRDPIFITSKGIIANGNTRISCMREFNDYSLQDAFKHVDCCVIPEENSEDWTYIRTIVDEMDNQATFKTDYPWYSRARRFEINCIQEGFKDILADENAGGPPKTELKIISDRMQYPNLNDAKKHYHMLILAREFISKKLLRFEKITDLNKLGGDKVTGDGYQAFKTLADNIKKVEDDDDFRELVLERVFGLISTNAQSKKKSGHDMNSQHLAVESIFGKSFLNSLRKDTNSSAKLDDAFGSAPKISKSKKVKKKSIFTGINKDKDAIYEAIKPDLIKAAQLKKNEAGKSIKNRLYKSLLEDFNSVQTLRKHILQDDSSNLDEALTVIPKFKEELDNLESDINSILESQA